MKFNWGTGIVIGIAAFMIFILQYVIRVQIDARYDNELVTEQYYQKETEVNSNYSKQQNANKLADAFQIKTTSQGIAIYFPKDFNPQEIIGTVSLYRPSNQAFDQTIPIELSSNYLLIPKSRLIDGRWDISIDFSYKGTDYLKQQTLHL
ncbi:FixH family protein [Flavobacterium sp. CBA20B-1]|uniref:FixH family protein n=1 Tax=unclassified Flavobacterium TaxID=196869 RepID=UPI0022243BE9|nr:MULTISPECIES: FixH family protein [unclassified Flavobacterium]WCM42159.1 FixH family protein [Flavobacterium sp. CBA20B-1]